MGRLFVIGTRGPIRPTIQAVQAVRWAKHESSEVIDICLPVTFYFNPSTRLDNVKNLWRFIIRVRWGYPDTELGP